MERFISPQSYIISAKCWVLPARSVKYYALSARGATFSAPNIKLRQLTAPDFEPDQPAALSVTLYQPWRHSFGAKG